MTIQGPVYRVSLKDYRGFPTFVVAGPDRHRVWLYVHDLTPTVLRLHPPVVRFLLAALTELAGWFEQPVAQRAPVVWTLPREDDFPECVLVASHQRAWMHVFAARPSVVRFNPGIVTFLLDEGLLGLPTWRRDPAHRWPERSTTDVGSVRIDELAEGRRELSTERVSERGGAGRRGRRMRSW